jgi:hypothetical protein
MTDLELVRRLQEVAVAEAGLKNVRELLKTDHTWRKAKFRDAVIYIARTKTALSLQEIGNLFGARHHTTILSAVRREEHRLTRKPLRHDKRTWPEWHDYLYNKALGETMTFETDAAKVTVETKTPEAAAGVQAAAAGVQAQLESTPPEPETPAPAMSEAEKGPDNA